MADLITSIGRGVPTRLAEVARLERTLRTRANDVLAFFDRPGTSNGPTEANNGRLAHLRGLALGFRNPTHYIALALLECGAFRPLLTHSVDWNEPYKLSLFRAHFGAFYALIRTAVRE